MRGRFHGVTSLLWVCAAIGLAAVALVNVSALLGAVYLAISAAGAAAILYAYCAKCPCKAHCGHVFPGKAAIRIRRAPGRYTPIEYSVLGTALALIIGLPQLWLVQDTRVFIAFWMLTGIGLIQIRAFVCRACHNVYCPLNQGSHNPT